jgi:hypothetical protein
MKDERVTFFRKALEGLIESLEATVRVTAWTGEETVPEPLKESASRLVDRLGTADRLASGAFAGSAVDIARVKSMCDAMRRLDAAYVIYRQKLETEKDSAGMNLGAELEEIKADVRRLAS